MTFDFALAGVCCTCTDTWPCDVTVEVMCDVTVFAVALLLLLIALLLLGTDGTVMVVGVLGKNWNTVGAVAAGMVARAVAVDVVNTATDFAVLVAAAAAVEA